LWTWFEEDAILTRLGHPRLHTTEDNYFIGNYLWDLLIEKICHEYKKKSYEIHDYHKHRTTIIEFSRGSEHGGYKRAFNHLDTKMIDRIAIMYIDVSWEESFRKNRARFNPKRPYSILEHGLPNDKLRRLYKQTDWNELSKNNPHYITIQNYQVPYIVFENEDDVTSQGGEVLSNRLADSLNKLWDLYKSKGA
jgi:hypothetical protein